MEEFLRESGKARKNQTQPPLEAVLYLHPTKKFFSRDGGQHLEEQIRRADPGEEMVITKCFQNHFLTESSSGEFGDSGLCSEKCCPLHSRCVGLAT